VSAKQGTKAKIGLVALGLSLALVPSAGLFAQQQAPAAAAPAADAGKGGADLDKGRELFATWGCDSCHTLEDAHATGHVGPALDHNPNITEAYVKGRVTSGQGAMPAFGGQMTDEEIATIAKYIAQVSEK